MGAIDTCEEADERRAGESGKMDGLILGELESFEEDGMEVDAFGLDMRRGVEKMFIAR